MSASAVPASDLSIMQYAASMQTLEGAQSLVETHAADSGARPGHVVRYVIVTESIVDDETRRIDVFAKESDGSGLYHWETMGFLEHALQTAKKRV